MAARVRSAAAARDDGTADEASDARPQRSAMERLMELDGAVWRDCVLVRAWPAAQRRG